MTLHVAMVVASDYAVDARVRRQAEALVQRGDRVTVIALGTASTVVKHDLLGVHVIELPVHKYRGYSARTYVLYYARFAWHAARQLLHIADIDLVQVHSMPEALVFCAVPQRLRGRPVLLDVHDLTSKLFEVKFGAGRRITFMRAIERASMRFASVTMTVHEPYSRMLQRTFGTAATDCPVVMNVPDAARWPARDWRQWGDDVVYAFHGSLVDRYGVVDMVEALAEVRKKRPAARLLVRGNGDAREAMIQRVHYLGIEDALDVSEGYIPLDEIPAALAPAHIGLAPYRLDPFMADSLPSKLLEYVAMEMPVVSARLPYIEELFGNSLWYFEPGDINGLVTSMLAAANDPDESKAKVQGAAEVLRGLSWDVQRARYFAIIDSLTRRDATAQRSDTSRS